jgi:hypothetical protein
MYECLVCNRKVYGTNWLCHACHKVYGPLSTWPAWLKALYNIEHENRRWSESSGENDVEIYSLEDDLDMTGRVRIRMVPELRT